jgi:hypothetical protein
MKNTYYLLLILSIISCDFPKPDIIKFHPESLEENEIKLSEIADDVIYIPLDNSYPIGIYYGYRFVGNSIYISVKDLGILEFDRHGNFTIVCILMLILIQNLSIYWTGQQ